MKRFFAYFFTIISVVYVPTLFVLALIPRSSEGAASYALNLLFFIYVLVPVLLRDARGRGDDKIGVRLGARAQKNHRGGKGHARPAMGAVGGDIGHAD